MTEDFLHYIWKYKYYEAKPLVTQDGKEVEIISSGIHNTNSGPDFFNAKIKIGDTTWVGNVEIHINASDWNKHLHFKDEAYNNVILHIVYHADEKIYNFKKQEVPTASIHFDRKIYEKYEKLTCSNTEIACAEFVSKVDNFTIFNWIDKILVERLEQKTLIVENLLETTKNDWNECFYIFLARSFGSNLNAYAFEMLAKSLSQKILAKHKSNLFQLEALLFGQAGMLNDTKIDDVYFLKLRKEYHFLQKKYKLKPIEEYLWKFLRLRPVSFPTIRISQLAKLIHQSNSLFSSIAESQKLKDLENFFQLEVSDYWETHYTFGGNQTKKKSKSLGKKSINGLIINSIIPFLFLYGKKKKQENIQQKAIDWLEEMKPETNKIISNWVKLGAEIKNAYQSQAYIQLMNEYCKPEKCLQCAIGNKILTTKQENLS